MKTIRILVCGSGDPQNNYAAALRELGAEPVSKYAPEVDTGYDGMILCGGCDVDPARYGEEINGAGQIDPVRDAAEFAILDALQSLDKSFALSPLVFSCPLREY